MKSYPDLSTATIPLTAQYWLTWKHICLNNICVLHVPSFSELVGRKHYTGLDASQSWTPELVGEVGKVIK